MKKVTYYIQIERGTDGRQYAADYRAQSVQRCKDFVRIEFGGCIATHAAGSAMGQPEEHALLVLTTFIGEDDFNRATVMAVGRSIGMLFHNVVVEIMYGDIQPEPESPD